MWVPNKVSVLIWALFNNYTSELFFAVLLLIVTHFVHLDRPINSRLNYLTIIVFRHLSSVCLPQLPLTEPLRQCLIDGEAE